MAEKKFFSFIKMNLEEFWRTYVFILTPFILLPILMSASGDSPSSAQDNGLPSPLSIQNITQESSSEETLSNYEPMVCAYVLLIMSVYWMTEALPLPVTSLIPIVAFPFFGVLSTNEIAVNYMKATNFMFLGGLILAIGVEYSGLHKRVALNILLLVGTSPKMIMLGFMATTAFLSMWISNTATVAMMLPIVDAVTSAIHGRGNSSVRVQKSAEEEKHRNILLIAVAYAANIGGTGVITGSPPNLVILEILPPLAGVNFATWMAFCVPLMLINLALAWLWLLLMGRWISIGRFEEVGVDPGLEDQSQGNSSLTLESDITLNVKPKEDFTEKDENDKNTPDKTKNTMRRQLEDLGKTSIHEWSILVCFVILILLWFFREPMFMKGWGDFLKRTTSRDTKSTIGDATPALLMVIIIFALPINYKFWPFQPSSIRPKKSPSLVSWELIEKRLPWGVIILLGGGFALSDACSKSGLSTWLVNRLILLRELPVWAINLIISITTTTVTEVVSNTATANILLPILKEMSLTLCQNPTYLVLTSVISCSYAFMLPVATAPNAIVFGASSMTTGDMMKAGFIMNLICIVTTNFAINTYGSPMFKLQEMPEWATALALTYGGNCTVSGN